MAEKLSEKVLRTARNYGLADPGDSVLAAVSGGPDSVFLLLVLQGLKNKLKIGTLTVCNVDHGIRGAESAADSLFVKSLAKNMGLKFIGKKINLKKDKAGVYSTEERAREERYRFFLKAAKDVGANVLATGHTLDDQAETIMMRIVKGASLKGVIGIPPVMKYEGLKVIRPLIELEKKEIVDYLKKEGIRYREDRTNSEPIYFRNIVRHEILPFLERYNPRLKRALFNLAEHLREDFQFIEEARTGAQNIISGAAGRVQIKLSDIAVQPRAIQKEILRDSLEKAGGLIKKLSFRHWKELEGLIARKSKGSSLDLPGGIRVTRKADRLIFHII